ncbi:hypothetical protein Ancab_038782 [Ancistrocladus abbreviatus]
MERNSNKYINEKRVSTESSRASFSSSSRSSSFSSLDCGRTGQPEPSSLDRIIFPETPSRDPIITHPSASPKFKRHSLDLRDVVKDSMYRESQGPSMQIAVEGADHALKHRDSPRPLQLSKSPDTSLGVRMSGKHDLPADLEESLRVLAKLREAPWYYTEKEVVPKLLPELKDGRISRDAPRFSYDGREMNHSSLESRDTFFKSAQKVKDLPRLSLDGQECTARSTSYDSKFMYLSRNMQRGNDGCDGRVSSLQQALVVQTRPASVVAKLMGLEAFPDTVPCSSNRLGPIKTFSLEDSVCFSIPSKTSDICRPIRLPNSSRSTRREPSSPRWKNPNVVMKPVSSSKFPIEPAPWKHHEGSRVYRKQGSKHMKSPSVYGEIEKRLKDLEFSSQSGKDLRALKQILETMQAKGLLDTTKEEQTSNVGSKRVGERRRKASDVPGLINLQDRCHNHVITPSLRANDPSKTSESPTVIMKPAKLVQKASIPASSIVPIGGLPRLRRPSSSDIAQGNPSVGRRIARDQTPKDSHRDRVASSTDRKTSCRNMKLVQTSTRPQSLAKDSNTSSIKSLGSTSPRSQQRKLEFDRKSRPPTPPSDSSIPRRQSNRQSSESSSPGGRRRPKFLNIQKNDEQLSERSNESSHLNCQGDDISVQSDTHLRLACEIDVEVTSAERGMEMTGCQSPCTETFKCSISGEMQNATLREDDPVEESASITPEHPIPSPVSVLDASAYREDSPSPVKQASHGLQDGEILKSDEIHEEQQWDSVDELSAKSGGSVVTSEMSRQKLQNIDNLVQKLRRLNSTHDEARTDYIASLCENTNPDHRYVSEILLASGLLLRDLSSGMTAFQIHPSGHAINPELYFVLEQTKASSLLLKQDKAAHSKPDPEKLNRKLIFDAVNEILTKKLVSVGLSSEPWLRPDKLTQKTLTAQKLLRELCAEIEQLQPKKSRCSLVEDEDGLKTILWEDVMQRSDKWTDFRAEISGLVLDVERSIFKDLVDEIVIGEAAAVKGKPNRHCRQLF